MQKSHDFTNTLYVTDLDGTLLRDDKLISETTVQVLNDLISRGVMITYATARTIKSASALTRGIHFSLPVILRNGTILTDPLTGLELEISVFSPQALKTIRQCLQSPALKGLAISGFVTSFIDHREYKSYLNHIISEGFRLYLADHTNDTRLRRVRSEDQLYEGDVCYFTFISDREALDPLYGLVKDSPEWVCVYQEDKYHPGYYWLEICPKAATKAQAIRKLQDRLGCDRLVVFGDSLNDISMFEIADEAYAVANAEDCLKKIATAVIGANDADGVAKWLADMAVKDIATTLSCPRKLFMNNYNFSKQSVDLHTSI